MEGVNSIHDLGALRRNDDFQSNVHLASFCHVADDLVELSIIKIIKSEYYQFSPSLNS